MHKNGKYFYSSMQKIYKIYQYKANKYISQNLNSFFYLHQKRCFFGHFDLYFGHFEDEKIVISRDIEIYLARQTHETRHETSRLALLRDETISPPPLPESEYILITNIISMSSSYFMCCTALLFMLALS